MKLNDLEMEFFDSVLNAELGVPVHATLVYEDNTFAITIVPEITQEGYFILKYSNAPAYDPETHLTDNCTPYKRLRGSEISGTHPLLERAWLDRDLVTVQSRISPLPCQDSVIPRLNARVHLAGFNHRGELVLDKGQVALEESPLKKAEFCIVGFTEFATPERQWKSILSGRNSETKVGSRSGSSKSSDDHEIGVRHHPRYVVLDSGDGWKIRLSQDETQTRDSVTHTGVIEKNDDCEYGIDELCDVLEGLKYFLAFTAGEYCHPTVVIAYGSHKRPIWGQIGRFDQDRQHPANWFNNSYTMQHGAVLERLFPRFWCKWREKRNEIVAVIECHVHSNAMTRAGVAKDAVAKSYAGLEILASLMTKKTIGGDPSKEIHKVLSECQIPNCLLTKELAPIMTRLCNDLGVKESQGAHLLNDVRNYVAHPLERKTAAEVKEKNLKYLDADQLNYVYLHDLSQFYLEYLFLQFCGCEAGTYRPLMETMNLTNESRD